MQVLFGFSLVEMESLDFQVYKAAQVIALPCAISGELWVVGWTREPR